MSLYEKYEIEAWHPITPDHQDWIKTSDRLPEIGHVVSVMCGGVILTAKFDGYVFHEIKDAHASK